MSNARPIAQRTTTAHLCPVFHSASKGCSYTDDDISVPSMEGSR